MTPPRPPHLLLAAVATAALSYFAHFPGGLGGLAWIALVPLLTLVRHPGSPWKIYSVAYLSGLMFYAPVILWLTTTDRMMYFAWAFLVLYGSLYPVFALGLIRRLDHRAGWPLVLSVPTVWTALEFARGNLLTGFPWYLLAHTQHDFSLLIQISDLGGAWMVSFLVLAVNGFLTEVWLNGEGIPRWSRQSLMIQGGILLTLFGTALGYGWYRLSEQTIKPGPLVALIQSNVEQGYRNEGYARPGVIRQNIEQHLFELTDIAAGFRPALIVWPETAVGGDFFYNPGRVPASELVAGAREFLGKAAENLTDERLIADIEKFFADSGEIAKNSAFRWKASLVLGLNSRVPDGTGMLRRHNSAVVVNRGGIVDGVYHKIHCVPFGEYAPIQALAGLMPFSYPYMIYPGNDWPRFTLQGEDGPLATFGVLICYEDTDPNISRPYGGSDGKAPVDFLVNISNDGWFVGSAEHAEHLAICRFRAIENRRAIVRSVNMGISAVVDSNGRVLKPSLRTQKPIPGREPETLPQLWEIGPEPKDWEALPVYDWWRYEVRSGVLLATVPLDSRTSLYLYWGDWFPWTCWALVLAGILQGWFRPSTPRIPEAGHA